MQHYQGKTGFSYLNDAEIAYSLTHGEVSHKHGISKTSVERPWKKMKTVRDWIERRNSEWCEDETTKRMNKQMDFKLWQMTTITPGRAELADLKNSERTSLSSLN